MPRDRAGRGAPTLGFRRRPPHGIRQAAGRRVPPHHAHAGQGRFTVVDPSGNSVIFIKRDAEEERPAETLSGLERAIATAGTLRDSKRDDAAAAKVLDVALARYQDAPPVARARALAARAELAVALGDTERLAALRAELARINLSDEDRERLRDELQAADELEETQG